MPTLGPLFRYELLRLSRKGSHVLQRVLLALVILVVLFFVYSNWFPSFDLGKPFAPQTAISLNQSARFAEVFVYALVMVQFIAVVVLTPVYVAGSITEEIDRRTIEHLFATELTSREIILGKVFARLLYVAGVVLTGLPIVALSQLFGGVSNSALVQGYAVVLGTMFLLGCFTIQVAVTKGNLQETVVLVYFYATFLSVMGICCTSLFRGGHATTPLSPPLYLYQLFHTDPAGLAWQTLALVAIEIGLGSVLLLAASAGMRRTILRRKNRAVDSVEHFYQRATETGGPFSAGDDLELVGREEAPPLPWGTRYRVGIAERIDDENPLLWKERNTRGDSLPDDVYAIVRGCLIGFVGFFLTILVLLGLLRLFAGGSGEGFNRFARFVGFFLLGFWVVAVGLKGATSVARERDRDTLTMLLTLPVERREILAAKWQAAWSRVRWVARWLGGLILFGIVCRAVNPFYVPLTACYVLSLLFLSTSLSIWLSTVSRGSSRATFLFLLGWLFILFVPYLLGQVGPVLARPFTDDRDVEYRLGLLCEFMSPWEAWNTLNLPLADGSLPFRQDEADFPLRVWGALFSCVAALVWGCLLWLLACQRFEREGRD